MNWWNKRGDKLLVGLLEALCVIGLVEVVIAVFARPSKSWIPAWIMVIVALTMALYRRNS